MSAHTKKRPTKNRLVVRDSSGRMYVLPKNIAEKYAISGDQTDTISAKTFFAPYEKKHSKPGLLLRGLRVREGLTQEQFATKINVTQANLSHMENGRRSIGKDVAQRIAKAFDVDYRIFL